MRLRPSSPELKVPMPERGGRFLNAKGEDVPDASPYWLRRLRDGSVIPCGAPEETPAKSERRAGPRPDKD